MQEILVTTMYQRSLLLDYPHDNPPSIRSLPAELVAHIMRFALELERQPLGATGRVRFVVLRSVSSLWRQTALTTPDLWRSLHICFDLTGPSLDTISSWFARAGKDSRVRLALEGEGQRKSDSWRCILTLLEHPSLNFYALHLGKGILYNLGDLRRICSPAAPKASVQLLTIELSEGWAARDDTEEEQEEDENWRDPFWESDLLHLDKAFPRLKSLVFQNHSRWFTLRVSHSDLVSLVLGRGYGPRKLFRQLSQMFPRLEELFLSRHFATCPASWGDASIIHLPMLKRLTVEIANQGLVDTTAWNICPPQVLTEMRALLRKSQADRIALRISEAPIEPLLTELLSTSIPIYQLDVQEIGWLNPTFCALRSEASIPSSLREIIVRGKPPTHDPSSIPQKPSWAADDASSPSRSGAAHTQRAEASAAGSTIQHIRVYMAGAREDCERLNDQYAWKTATVELSCHCVTETIIETLVHQQSPALCHEYEKLCLG
ncbi:hypothetical protein BKA70DRAFT_1570163 [Coprinopsis sp. MPI-PUGE-AT-0042]|nr:hypothetical protein BKA70DRAFT_1570163 [Coprinopsis sp. MPI-PUGE-AT-0042]